MKFVNDEKTSIICFSIDKIEIFEKTSKYEICKRKKNVEIVDSLIDRNLIYDKTLINAICKRKKKIEIVDLSND